MSDIAPSSLIDKIEESEAAERAAIVADPSYRIVLALDRAQNYSGETIVRFRRKAIGRDTFLDFRGGAITRATINGQALPPIDRERCRIPIPAALMQDLNEVVVRYENDYDRGGVGLHRFTDPEDGEAYLYTDFEPFNAHRLFPCFDQPDLKASFDLETTTPSNWTVVANGREVSVVELPDRRTRRRFSAPFRFSTYLFAVVAGPYFSVRREMGGVDMGILCRKALAKHLDADAIFEVTHQGFEFYTEHFGVAYPFGKYDQIFVPEYNSGAMENIAAVTFNEAYIFRDPPTDAQLLGRAEVVLHELAHMWFGNLVTMKWWNDLWLNESFATYASYLAMSKATRFQNCWENFRSQIKAWALREDQKPTTHPIAGSVSDTDQTFLNFDGITYGKGASVLKQLAAHIGETAFRDGLRIYFARHAWGNTVAKDFLVALGEGAGRDLSEWSRLWLETSGVNVCCPKVERKGATIVGIDILMEGGNGDSVRRPLTLLTSVFKESGAKLERAQSAKVDTGAAATTAVPIAAVENAAFVWPDDGDHGYAKFFLDEVSLDNVLRRFESIDDALVRQCVLGSIWDMVRDAVLDPLRYVEWALRVIETESRSDVLDVVIRTTQTALARFLSAPVRAKWADRAFDLAERCASDSSSGEDRSLVLLRSAPGFSFTTRSASRLSDWLDGKGPSRAADDQGLRWRVIVRMSAFACAGAASAAAREIERDPSDRGQKMLYAAQCAAPTPAAKEKAFEDFVRPGGQSADLKKSGMGAFFWSHQEKVVRPFAERYFEALPRVLANHDLEYATRGFARLLYPHNLVEKDVLLAGERALAELPADSKSLRRVLLEENDELARAVRIRTKFPG